MATYRLTFLATTKLWDTNATTGIIDPYPSILNASVGGPYAVSPVIVPFDPIRKTGGSFWFLTAGPNIGKLVSQHTNDLGYGSILLENITGTPFSVQTHVNPKAPWRLLIKGMGGDTGLLGKNQLTFNSATDLWSRTTTGIINYDRSIAEFQGAGTGGPWAVNPIVVPFDPEHETGGSFWRLTEGPYTGWLVSFWSNSLGYGDISVAQEEGFDRGPGEVIATFGPGDVVPTLASGTGDKKAHSAGASLMYNDAGEMHFTLLNDHPLVRVPFPKQTHYAIEFWNVDTEEWDEVFAGMIWDFDATDTEVVFYGMDYLSLYRYTIDERFDTRFVNKPAPTGTRYVDKTITEIVTAHLTYAQTRSDSIVGFIAIGDIAAMTEKVTIDSAFQSTLDFVVGMIYSHRAGTGKQTRIKVIKISGVYTVVVEDDPGIPRDNLALEYGDLAQGYRVIPFGVDWASRVNIIAQNPKGERVMIRADSSAVDQGTWGRIGQGAEIIAVIDENDLKRRALQAAIDASRLGKQISVGLKLGSLRPLEGYDICDTLPVVINHGAVQTENWGSDDFGIDAAGDPSGSMASYWTILGITWESYDDSHWMTDLILFPRGRRPLGECNASLTVPALYDSGLVMGGAFDATPATNPIIIEIPNPPTTPSVMLALFVGVRAEDAGTIHSPSLALPWTMMNSFTETSYNDHIIAIGMLPTPTDDAPDMELSWSSNGSNGGGIRGRPRYRTLAVTVNTLDTAPIQKFFDSTGPGIGGTVTLPQAPTEGNVLIYMRVRYANPGFPQEGPPAGFTVVHDIYGDFAFGTNISQWMVAVKCVGAGESATQPGSIMDGSTRCFQGMSEWGPGGLDVPSTSDPIINRTPIGVGHGPPPATGSNPANTDTYVDLDTGQVYEWDDDDEEWTATGGQSPWATMIGIPGPEGPEGPEGPMGPPGQGTGSGSSAIQRTFTFFGG